MPTWNPPKEHDKIGTTTFKRRDTDIRITVWRNVYEQGGIPFIKEPTEETTYRLQLVLDDDEGHWKTFNTLNVDYIAAWIRSKARDREDRLNRTSDTMKAIEQEVLEL